MSLSPNNTAEILNPVVPKSAGQARPDHLSTDVVSLEIPVKLQGSRVGKATDGSTTLAEPFEEFTTTLIVLANGAVLRMSSAVTVGQILVITNQKSNQDAICRVVRVRKDSSLARYAEVELTQNLPSFWGVAFTSNSLASPSIAPASTNTTTATPNIALDLSTPNQPLSEPSTPVLTMLPIKLSSARDTAPILAQEEEIRGSVLPSFQPAELPSAAELAEAAPQESSNWKMIAVGVGVAVVLGASWFSLGHSRSSSNSNSLSPAAQISPAAPLTTAARSSVTEIAQTKPKAAVSTTRSTESQLEARTARPNTPSAEAHDRETSSTKHDTGKLSNQAQSVTSNLFGALNAHPISSARKAAGQSSAPPAPDVLSGSSAEPNVLAGVSPAIPVALGQPSTPRLISSVRPVYPETARAINAQGEVVLEATVDATGHVGSVKAVSGPLLLRQAAMDALSQWKYEPGIVNGKPAASQIRVTIRFQM